MPYTTVVAGTTITAAWGNANVRDQVLTPWASSAARDSAVTAPVEGMVHHLNDLNALTIYSGSAWEFAVYPAHGGLVSWTPVVTQSNTPTLTNTYSRYSRVGRRIFFESVVTLTASGTATNDVSISLPVAANISTATVIGTGMIQDVSASGQYFGPLIATTSTTAKIASSTSLGVYLGGGSSTFTAALASGDFVKVQGSYESTT